MSRALPRLILCAGIALSTSGCLALTSPYGAAGADVTSVYAHDNLGSKRGQASATCTLGLFFNGDAGIEAARRAGGITRITHIDRKVETDLFTYTITTIVYGD